MAGYVSCRGQDVTFLIKLFWVILSSLQFSLVAQLCLTVCNSMGCNTRPPCPSPTPGAYSNSCPWSQWCHPNISSSVIPFSSCLQSFSGSGSFPMSQFFSIRWPKYWSFSFSISPSNEYSGIISFRMDWFDLLAVQGTLKIDIMKQYISMSRTRKNITFRIHSFNHSLSTYLPTY